jgi:hypothetical protein
MRYKVELLLTIFIIIFSIKARSIAVELGGAFVVELQILMTALVVWGITHALQFAPLVRNNLSIHNEWGYKLCHTIRIVAIGVSVLSFLVWVWWHMVEGISIVCAK